MTYREALHEALSAYLEEFEGDGYDTDTFVDFVVTEVHKPRWSSELVDWYRDRADTVEREAQEASARLDTIAELRQRVSDLETELARVGGFVLLEHERQGTWRLVSRHGTREEAARASEALVASRTVRGTFWGTPEEARLAGHSFRDER